MARAGANALERDAVSLGFINRSISQLIASRPIA
jgi:hypothetical protein